MIELLVVISIIGLLSSVVLVSLGSARAKARDAKRLSDIHQVVLALDLYHDSNGQRFPSSDNDGCGSWDVGNQTLPFMMVSGVSTLGSLMSLPPRDQIATGNCGGYRYYRYGAGSYGCDAVRGAYYVIEVDMETKNPWPGSPGWSCSGRNWQNEGSYVTGKFENF